MKQLRRLPSVPETPKASDLWRTPLPLFAVLHLEFAFDLDLAANTEDHLCDRWLGPGGLVEDALTVRWAQLGRCGFLNPPYSSKAIAAFLSKVVEEAIDGFTTVALTPYTPDTGWWQQMQYAAEIREIPHRVPYRRADGVTAAGAMFPSAVAVFRPQPGVIRGDPRRVVWTYRGVA